NKWVEAGHGYNMPFLTTLTKHPVYKSDKQYRFIPEVARVSVPPSWPGPTTAASQQVLDLYIIPDMFAQHVTGTPTADPAVAWPGSAFLRAAPRPPASTSSKPFDKACESAVTSTGRTLLSRSELRRAGSTDSPGSRPTWSVAKSPSSSSGRMDLFRPQRTPRIPSRSSSRAWVTDRKSTRLNSSHEWISYAVFCLK